MTVPPCQALPNVALLWRFTRRTVGRAPQPRVKFVPFSEGPSSAGWAASRTGTRAVSYSEQFPVAGRISVASRSVAPPTRLETRTKESNMRASHWVC